MDKSRSAETILVISLGFLGLFLVFHFRRDTDYFWMLYTAFSIGAVGLASKWLREQIHVFWFWIAEKMGYVMSRLLLSIVFFIFLIPFGFLARLFRKDLMFMKKSARSYYKKRNHLYSFEDLENPW